MGGRIPLLATGLAIAVGGCFLLPAPRPWIVYDVSDVDGYLSASFAQDKESLAFYFRPTAECRKLLVEAASVFYRARGPLGTVERDEHRCVPVGIGRLASWARRNPTPRDLPILPSLPAHFSEIHREADVVLVRGDFPLAGLVYFHSGRDAVAFLPTSESCERYIAQGGANMQYKRSTKDVVWLGSATDKCRMLGLAYPLSP